MTATDQRVPAGRQQADEWAAQARRYWQAGRLALAAACNHACRQADPDRTPLWTERALRLLAAAENRSLAERSAVRLAVAGIGPDDPGLSAIRGRNQQARERVPQREAGQ